MIRILDSATHPTISGNWISGAYDCSFESLHRELQKQEFLGACAIGLPRIGGYEHSAFMKECANYPEMIPIAGISPLQDNNLNELFKMGFRGIKIHPRIVNLNIVEHESEIVNAFSDAAKAGLAVFFCTYFATSIQKQPIVDPLLQLVRILKQTPDTKVILMHGGTTRLLEYADLARFNPNILLDLSYTMIKYRGSSVELDVRYLFRTMDLKVCIGSDHPEIRLDVLKKTFQELTAEIPAEKQENIGFRNLLTFLNVPMSVFDKPRQDTA
jgi:predicted TIM-barrel fold metal-dependent hydrolase